MRFEHEGEKYWIEFQRDKHRLNRQGAPAESTYPYTTARLLKRVVSDGGITSLLTVAFGTAGCWHQEPEGFDIEQGRKEALKKVSKSLKEQGFSHEFRTKMWDAYRHRVKRQVIIGEVVETTDDKGTTAVADV